MSEVCHREGIQLLPYSPLGFGVLTGKYINQTADSNARLNKWLDYKRYSNEHATVATKKYMEIANDYNVSHKLALQFVTSRPFVISNIIGATKIEQLKENIRSVEVEMSDELLARFKKSINNHPNPSP